MCSPPRPVTAWVAITITIFRTCSIASTIVATASCRACTSRRTRCCSSTTKISPSKCGNFAEQHARQPVWFYSGYDCDSLANEPMTRFTDYFIPLLATIDNAWMELRTKSTQVRGLLKTGTRGARGHRLQFQRCLQPRSGWSTAYRRSPGASTPCAASWKPAGRSGTAFRPGRLSPRLPGRLQGIARADFQRHRRQQPIHSVSLGSFRLTRDHFRNVSRLYPEEPLFAQPMAPGSGYRQLSAEREREMIEFCETALLQHIPTQSYHPCALA